MAPIDMLPMSFEISSSLLPRLSGIYRILHLTTGKVYIGSTQDFRGRFATHRSNLNSGDHGSIHLQRLWNKSLPSCFLFQILEYCSIDMLLIREQYYINHHINSGLLLNCNLIAGSTRGYQHTEQTKKLISDRVKTIIRDTPDDTKKLRTEKATATNKSKDHYQKLARIKAKKYKVTFPDGHIEAITNMRDFIRQHELNWGNVSRVIRGMQKSHKGFKFESLD